VEETGADAAWRVGKVMLRATPERMYQLRPLNEGKELLLKLDLPKGQSTLELTYEILP